MRFMILLLLFATLAVAHADKYQTTNTLVAEQRYQGLQRTVVELKNRSSDPMGFYYSLDKETCWSWNVSSTVLSRFSLGRSTQGCRSTGSYTTSGTLQPGYTLAVLAKAVHEYLTYYAERQRVYDDGTVVVLDSVYATKADHYELFWRSIHR